MPAALTAENLVYMVRDKLLVYDHDILRDGFSDDVVKLRRRSILKAVNSHLAKWAGTGYLQCRFYISVEAGTYEYGLDDRIHEIEWVQYQGHDLRQTSEAEVKDRHPAAYTDDDSGGTPREYWYRSDVLGLYPMPDTTDTGHPTASEEDSSLCIMAYTVPSDLSARSDTLSRIPIEVQHLLPTCVAYEIAGELSVKFPAFAARQANLYPEYMRAEARLQEIVQSRQPNERDSIRPGGRRRNALRTWRY